MDDPILLSILAVLALCNAMACVLYWLDKARAKRGGARISEARLLQASFVGPLGSMLGICLLRHKSRKVSYLIKYMGIVLVSLLAHISGFYGYFYW